MADGVFKIPASAQLVRDYLEMFDIVQWLLLIRRRASDPWTQYILVRLSQRPWNYLFQGFTAAVSGLPSAPDQPWT